MDKIEPIKVECNFNEAKRYLEELRLEVAKALGIDSSVLFGEDNGFSKTRK